MKDDYIFFWGGIYSNFYPCTFTVGKYQYNCSEQFFMAQKALYFNDEGAFIRIMDAKTPKEQKSIGRTIENFDVDKWSAVSRGYMYEGVYAKFSQNQELLVQLLSTNNKKFSEASPEDKIWGIGLHETDPLAWEKETWQGLNWLGDVITKVRDDIREERKKDDFVTMKLKVLKDWVNMIPDEYLDCDVVCSMEFNLNDTEDIRIDREVIGLAVDKETKEILIKIGYNEDLDKIEQ